jgi:outer membrane protein OmpA-like peptidoglycan-associated protein
VIPAPARMAAAGGTGQPPAPTPEPELQPQQFTIGQVVEKRTGTSWLHKFTTGYVVRLSPLLVTASTRGGWRTVTQPMVDRGERPASHLGRPAEAGFAYAQVRAAAPLALSLSLAAGHEAEPPPQLMQNGEVRLGDVEHRDGDGGLVTRVGNGRLGAPDAPDAPDATTVGSGSPSRVLSPTAIARSSRIQHLLELPGLPGGERQAEPPPSAFQGQRQQVAAGTQRSWELVGSPGSIYMPGAAALVESSAEPRTPRRPTAPEPEAQLQLEPVGGLAARGGASGVSPMPAADRQFRDQNRRDVGKSQPIWTDSKMETPGLHTNPCGSEGPAADRLRQTQGVLDHLRYRRSAAAARPPWSTEKHRPLLDILESGRQILEGGKPIRSLEAVMVALYLTQGIPLVDRFPLLVQAHMDNKRCQHMVLAVRVGGRWGCLGLSRYPGLMWKSPSRTSLAHLIHDFQECYRKLDAVLLNVTIGKAVSHSPHQLTFICWKHRQLQFGKDQDEPPPRVGGDGLGGNWHFDASATLADKIHSTASSAQAFNEACELCLKRHLINANFEANSAILTEDTVPIMLDLAVICHRWPKVFVLVDGHADSGQRPSVSDDQLHRLSQQRAEVVKAELVKLGVPAEHIRANGSGCTGKHPITGSHVESGGNRLVYIAADETRTVDGAPSMPSYGFAIGGAHPSSGGDLSHAGTCTVGGAFGCTVGDVMLRIEETSGITFSGSHLFEGGLWKSVVGELLPNGNLQLTTQQPFDGIWVESCERGANQSDYDFSIGGSASDDGSALKTGICVSSRDSRYQIGAKVISIDSVRDNAFVGRRASGGKWIKIMGKLDDGKLRIRQGEVSWFMEKAQTFRGQSWQMTKRTDSAPDAPDAPDAEAVDAFEDECEQCLREHAMKPDFKADSAVLEHDDKLVLDALAAIFTKWKDLNERLQWTHVGLLSCVSPLLLDLARVICAPLDPRRRAHLAANL